MKEKTVARLNSNHRLFESIAVHVDSLTRVRTAFLVALTTQTAFEARKRATDSDRNLLANDLGDTSRHRNWHFLTNTFRYRNRLCVVHWLTNRIRNLLDAGFCNHFATPVGYLFGMAFPDDTTNTVRTRLNPFFRNHLTNLVSTGFNPFLRNHLTYSVSTSFNPLFGHHLANLVRDGFNSFFRHHSTDGVITDFRLTFFHHATNFISAGFHSFLWHHSTAAIRTRLGAWFSHVSADCVGYLLLHTFLYIPHAIDSLFTNFRDPHLPTNCSSRNHTFCKTAATAARSTVTSDPTNSLLDNPIRSFTYAGFPVTATHFDCLGVVNRLTRLTRDCSITRFVNWLAHRVMQRFRFGFPYWLADRVADFLGLCFPNWLADRVIYGPLLGLINRLTHRIADVFRTSRINWLTDRITSFFGLRFPYRLANGVTDFLRTSLVNRLADCVADFLCLGFPNWLAHGVLTGSVFRLINRLADRRLALTIPCFRHVFDTVDRLLFTNRLIDFFVTSVLLFLVNDLATPLHQRITSLLGHSV